MRRYSVDSLTNRCPCVKPPNQRARHTRSRRVHHVDREFLVLRLQFPAGVRPYERIEHYFLWPGCKGRVLVGKVLGVFVNHHHDGPSKSFQFQCRLRLCFYDLVNIV